MTKELKKEIFEHLEKKSLEITEQVVLEEIETADYVCRAAFTTIRGETGVAFFETMILDVWEDMSVLDIRVIPQFLIQDSGMEETRKMVEQMNAYIPLGALGIQFDSGHLFWRLNLPVDEDKTAEEIAAYTITMYEKLATIIGAIYEAMEKVASGESTFEEMVEAGSLVGQ